MTNTLQLGRRRAPRIDATPAAIAVEVRLGWQDRHFDVLGFHGCAPVSKMCVLAGFADSHSYSLSYKPIPPGMTAMKLLHIDSSVPRPPLRQPKSFPPRSSTACVRRRPGLENRLSGSDHDPASLASVGLAPCRSPRGGARGCTAAGPRRPAKPCWDEFFSRRHRRARRTHVQFSRWPSQLKALDRPYRSGGEDLQIRRARRGRGWAGKQAGHHRDLARADSMAPGHAPRAALEHLENLFARGCFGFIGVANPEFHLRRWGFKSDRSTARRRWRARAAGPQTNLARGVRGNDTSWPSLHPRRQVGVASPGKWSKKD